MVTADVDRWCGPLCWHRVDDPVDDWDRHHRNRSPTDLCGPGCALPVGNRAVLWTTTIGRWHNLLISYICVSTRC